MITPPRSISPSSAGTFRQCPKKYQYSAIDRIGQPPTVATTKGTVVHRALELLFSEVEREQRNRTIATTLLQRSVHEHEERGIFAEIEGFSNLPLFIRQAEQSLDGYFTLEDPTLPNMIMTEQKIAQVLGDVTVLGIIDRVDQLPDGSLVVIDYKTGRVPKPQDFDDEFTALRTYGALLSREFGQVPVSLWLYYVSAGITEGRRCSTDIATSAEEKILSTYGDIVAACDTGVFEPKPSWLCKWCAYAEYCPGEAPIALKNTRTMN